MKNLNREKKERDQLYKEDIKRSPPPKKINK